MRNIMYLVLALATIGVGWGLLGPQLISMRIDVAVYAGLAVSLIGVPCTLHTFWKMWREDPATDDTVASIRRLVRLL